MDKSLKDRWFEEEAGHFHFKFSLSSHVEARTAALECSSFCEDDEDEQVDDNLISCFNCAYRRWLRESFECIALFKLEQHS